MSHFLSMLYLQSFCRLHWGLITFSVRVIFYSSCSFSQLWLICKNVYFCFCLHLFISHLKNPQECSLSWHKNFLKILPSHTYFFFFIIFVKTGTRLTLICLHNLPSAFPTHTSATPVVVFMLQQGCGLHQPLNVGKITSAQSVLRVFRMWSREAVEK